MSFDRRIAAALAGTSLLKPSTVRAALERKDLDASGLDVFMSDPGDFPYGRTLLHKDDRVECLLMNWAQGRECAPHDHGASWGWVAILEGEASHKVYRLDARGVPVLRREERVKAGRWLFAPKGLVHSMGNPTSNRLVSLHTYVPTIALMRVYDPARCASCIVGDGCGAWWPAVIGPIRAVSTPKAD